MAEYAPGQPTRWSIEQGTVPPHARNDLTQAGVNPDDPAAVLLHYTTGYYDDPGNRPYWLRDWAARNGLAHLLPAE